MMKKANILVFLMCSMLSGCVAALATVGGMSGISDAVVGAIKDETKEQVSGAARAGVRQVAGKDDGEVLSEKVRANRIARVAAQPAATDADLAKAWELTKGSQHEDIRDAWGVCSRKSPENLYRLSGQVPADDRKEFAALVVWLDANGCAPSGDKVALWKVFAQDPSHYPVAPAAVPEVLPAVPPVVPQPPQDPVVPAPLPAVQEGTVSSVVPAS